MKLESLALFLDLVIKSWFYVRGQKPKKEVVIFVIWVTVKLVAETFYSFGYYCIDYENLIVKNNN